MGPHEHSSARTGPSLRFVHWALGLMVAALLLMLLVSGRSFLIPLVLGVLVSSLVSAWVERIRGIAVAGRHLPSGLATALAVVLLGLALVVVYVVMADQMTVLMQDGPQFLIEMQQAILQLAGWVSEDLAESLQAAFLSVNMTPWFRMAAESIGGVLVTVVMVGIYVGFLLAERPWVQAKVAKLFPDPQRHARAQANIAAIRHNVHHYLLLKTLISAVTGGMVYAIALLFGLQFALLIGLMTFFLNFIPSLGSIIATALPVLVALVQMDSLSMVLAVLAVVGVVQFVMGNIVDPMVTGSSLQMSSLAIIVSLTFWSAVWGTVGMFLAVPMMVIVLIICAQVPALRPVAVLLSKTGEVPDVVEEDSTAAAATTPAA